MRQHHRFLSLLPRWQTPTRQQRCLVVSSNHDNDSNKVGSFSLVNRRDTKRRRLIVKTQDKAKSQGIDPWCINGFLHPFWCSISMFGPDKLKDHVHGALPQGILHAIHEGLLKYTIRALLETTTASCVRRNFWNLTNTPEVVATATVKGKKAVDSRPQNATIVLKKINTLLKTFCYANARCSNVELLAVGKWYLFSDNVCNSRGVQIIR